jgi:hypothetical protein
MPVLGGQEAGECALVCECHEAGLPHTCTKSPTVNERNRTALDHDTNGLPSVSWRSEAKRRPAASSWRHRAMAPAAPPPAHAHTAAATTVSRIDHAALTSKHTHALTDLVERAHRAPWTKRPASW